MAGRTEAEISRRLEAWGADAAWMRENALVGTPAQIVDRLGHYAGAGASRAYLQIRDMADLDHLDLIAAEVLPHLSRP